MNNANKVHEIKCLLSALLGFIELFDKNNLTKKQLETFNYIQSIAKDTHQLSHDVLNAFISQQQNHNQLHNQKLSMVNIASIINKNLSILQPAINKKFLKITTNYQTNQLIYSDNNIINLIIINILNNAIQYNSKYGEININLIAKNKNQAIIIRDTGIGMSQDKINQILSGKLSSTKSNNNTNHGIGLNNVRILLTEIKSQLEIASQTNSGTTVTVTILDLKPKNND